METRIETERRGRQTSRPSDFPPEDLHPLTDLPAYFRAYARQRPRAMALACLAVGFVLGWRLKPW